MVTSGSKDTNTVVAKTLMLRPQNSPRCLFVFDSLKFLPLNAELVSLHSALLLKPQHNQYVYMNVMQSGLQWFIRKSDSAS